MAVTTIYLGTNEQDIFLDEPLGDVGLIGQTATIESETCFVISGFGSRHLVVERGAGGSTKAPHAIGTTVTLSGGFVIPGTTDEGQQAAQVQITERVAGSGGDASLLAAYGAAGGGLASVQGGEADATHTGGFAQLVGGAGGNENGARIAAGGGGLAAPGVLEVKTNDEQGDYGQALVANPDLGIAIVTYGGIGSGTAIPTAAADFNGILPLYVANGTALYLLAGTAVVGPWDAA